MTPEQNTHPILLPLNSAELMVVLDALVEHAVECDRRGDACNSAPIANTVASRARALRHIDTEITRQALLALGIGVGRGRPQG